MYGREQPGSVHTPPRQETPVELNPVVLCYCFFFFRFSCYTTQYTAKWSHESEFNKILIGPKMLTDHMPDILMRALDNVVADRAICVSCPAHRGTHVDMV